MRDSGPTEPAEANGTGWPDRLPAVESGRLPAVESGRALVLSGGVPMGSVAPPYDFSWAFVLSPVDYATTRFVVRERYAYTTRWAPLFVEPVSVVSFVMTRQMLSGVRERAERVTRLAIPTA